MISPVVDDVKGRGSLIIITSSICFFKDKCRQRIRLRIHPCNAYDCCYVTESYMLPTHRMICEAHKPGDPESRHYPIMEKS